MQIISFCIDVICLRDVFIDCDLKGIINEHFNFFSSESVFIIVRVQCSLYVVLNSLISL